MHQIKKKKRVKTNSFRRNVTWKIHRYIITRYQRVELYE